MASQSRLEVSRNVLRIRCTLCRRRHNVHPLRVAIRILSHYGVRDPDVACAALLHDTVEDHADDITDSGTPEAALKVLARRFGARTAALVAAVTNPAWEPARDAGEQYREHVAASLEACPWARVVKASDFTDNAGAPRGALSYPRCSRDELEGGSWVRWLT
jgi:hypothetical protein